MVKIAGLRKKASLVIIIPLIIAVVLTRAAAVIPLYLLYPQMLENFTTHMIENQKEYLQSSSLLFSQIASFTILQQISNSINIGGDLMQKYYFYVLKTRQLNISDIQLSYEAFLEEYPHSGIPLYNTSMWFYRNNTYDELNLTEKSHVKDAMIFDPVFKAFSELNNKILTKEYGSSYLVFNDYGFYFVNPAEMSNFSPNCNGSQVGFYDPRCSFFYSSVTKQKGDSSVVVTPPYIFDKDSGYGQTACRGQWNYTNSQLLMTYCIDFTLKDLFTANFWEGDNKHIYSYIADTNGFIIEYDGIFDISMVNQSIVQLEIPKGHNAEANYFSKYIMPLFYFESTKLTHYNKKGEKMIVSVSPIMLTLSPSSAPTHYASVGLVLKNEYLKDKFDHLLSTCTNILNIGNYFGIALVILIAFFCILLTDGLSKSLIHPIDNLLIILNRMLEGDLEVDIIAALKPSPLEIHNLYEVFDELRVVLRFTSIHTKDLTQASLIYSQALNLFIKFGNYTAMEICYKELGYIAVQKKIWSEATCYLYTALKLAEKNGELEKIEMAKRKVEVADCMCKSAKYKEKGLKIVESVLKDFQDLFMDEEICEIFLVAAEIAYESGVRKEEYLQVLDFGMDKCGFYNKEVMVQRYLYIKALFLRNNGLVKDAVRCLATVLEGFAVYLPPIREKALNVLKGFFSDSLLVKRLFQHSSKIRSHEKDVVLVVSSSLAQNSVSSYITDFVSTTIAKNDRLALIQFHTRVKLIFNLTKAPMKIMGFRHFASGTQFKLFDGVAEGIRQIEVQKNFLREKKRMSWIVVVTDVEDCGSDAEVDKICEDLKEFEISVIFVVINVKVGEMERICVGNDFSFVLEVNEMRRFSQALKEVEAYLCPEKEVISIYDEVFNL